MKDEELFWEQFSKIAAAVAIYYPFQSHDRHELAIEFDKTIQKWESNIEDFGEAGMIKRYEEEASKHGDLLMRYKNALDPNYTDPRGPIQGTRAEILSQAFFWASMVKIDAFYIEYLKLPSPAKETAKKEVRPLVYFFEKESRYKHIMQLMVERGYCQANTYIWKKGKGKSTLACILERLRVNGYFRDKGGPTVKEMVGVALVTFGVKISESTYKQANAPESLLEFIPIATTLP